MVVIASIIASFLRASDSEVSSPGTCRRWVIVVVITGAAAAAFLICPSHCVRPDGLLESFQTDFAEILKREHFSVAEFSDDI